MNDHRVVHLCGLRSVRLIHGCRRDLHLDGYHGYRGHHGCYRYGLHLRHHVSPNGFYRGRKVLKTKAEA